MGIVERSGIWECDDAIVEVRVRIWSPPRVTWGISLSILEPGAEETCAILPHIGTVAFGFSGRVFFSGGGRRFSRLVAKFLATMDSGIFFRSLGGSRYVWSCSSHFPPDCGLDVLFPPHRTAAGSGLGSPGWCRRTTKADSTCAALASGPGVPRQSFSFVQL